MGRTDNLPAPQNPKDFNKDWAERILLDYKAKNDPNWIFSGVLRVLYCSAKLNPNPGMLRNSYLVQVSYKEGKETQQNLHVASWFAKVKFRFKPLRL